VKKFYVYTLSYPDGTVFYVGKGTKKRIDIHEHETKIGYEREIHQVIRSIWSQGQKPVKSIIFETDDNDEAITYEQKLIASIGLEHLVNRTVNRDAGISPTGMCRKVRIWIRPAYK